jgi:riboflavin synthase
MFTGIIDHFGTITKIENIPGGIKTSGIKLWIQTNFNDLELGESISVNGICLTVTEFKQNIFCCDLSSETLKTTTAQFFKNNQSVNLERALQLSSRIGGHLVSGHVDQVAYVKNIHQENEFTEMTFSGVEKENRKLMTKKGSIVINGVSLTVNQLAENDFTVMLIPHTLERTMLKDLRETDAVNIEFDMIARMIAEHIKASGIIP